MGRSAPRLASLVAALLVGGLGFCAIGCGSESPHEDLETAVAAALARGDRSAAIERLEDQPLGEDPAEVLRLARLFAATGEATRARWRIEEGLSRFPDDESLRIALARVALLLSDPREASDAAARISEDSERHAEALMLRAQAALALGELEEALVLYDEFADRYPERPDAILARIATLEREHRLEEALVAAESAASLVAEGHDALADSGAWLALRRAILLGRLDRRDEAVDLLREIVAERPETPQAWSMLLELEARAGKGQAVADALIAAVDADPARRGLYPMAIAIHRRAGRDDAADALTETILEEAENVSPFLAVANDRLSEGDFEAALALHDRALARFPESAELRLVRFDLLLALGWIEDARQEQARLAELLPNTEPALEYLRARLELADGKPALARTRLERLVPEFDRAPTQHWLGAALEALGDDEGARTRYGLAMHRDRDWALPQHALWRHARAARDWPAVVGFGRSLLMRQPDDPAVWSSVVRALIELGEPEQALATAHQARERLVEDASMAVAEAQALRALGRVDEALAALASAESDAPEQSTLWAGERALVLAQSGRVREALSGLAPALEAHPDEPQLLFVQSSILYALGRADEGDRETDRLLALAPTRIDARYNRCRFRVASGRYAEAIDDCRRAAEVFATNPEPPFVLGIALERSGDRGGAETAYARALALDPRDVRPAVNLGELRLVSGDVERALEVAQAAYRVEPEHPNVLHLLGRLYARTGRAERAAFLLSEAARVAPDRPGYAREAAAAQEQAKRSHVRTTRSTSDAALPVDTRAAPSTTRPHVPAERLAALDRPNVVLFLVDTLRADATTPYGHPGAPTPEVARWAERGVVFERVRAHSSWTKISMASLMTSLWPRSHGIVEADDGLGPTAVTLAEAFSEAGYATAAVQTNGWLHQSFGFHQGFDRYLFPQGGRGRGFEKPSIWPHADRVVAEGIEILARRDPNRPFFLYLHFMDVHEYAAPPEFKRYGTSMKGNYVAATRWVDDAVERVRREIERLGLLDETILVFASDHGETFGEHDVHGHARNVLSPVVHVPLVVRLPFALVAPLRIPQQVRNLDVAPTLLELAGIEVPAPFEGASLVPLMTGEEQGQGRVSFARLGVPLFPDASAQTALHDGDWTYARNDEADADDPQAWRSRAVDPGLEQLFEHAIDPGENVDLMATEPEQAARLRAALEAHVDAGGADVRQQGIRIDPGIAEKLRALGYLR
jgi:arylsulfatase A-like enzyme/Flp pilus assembly protein TadD